MLTLLLWLVWKAYPDVAICTAFWLSVIWFIHSKNVIRCSGGSFVLLGVVLNALVTEANGGVMPVIGMPTHFRAASPIWQSAGTNNHFLLLADHMSLHFFSLGDLALLGGALIFIVAKLQKKLVRRSECYEQQ
jgi:hypothetical protein